MSLSHVCWLCGGLNITRKRRSNFSGNLVPKNFQITDSSYGTTLAIYSCSDCGLQFCPDAKGITEFYAEMEDSEYEATRASRTLQAKKLVASIHPFTNIGKLLDVGAGSGIFVAEALKAGYQATGVEPSRSLVDIARGHGITIEEGTLTLPKSSGKFDVVTLVDVIEHVEDPAGMMENAAAHLKPGGVCILVTPDVGSWPARLLGYRWWHYRLAHISYFDKNTLAKLVSDSDLEVTAIKRPGWYFPASYLLTRLLQYLPARLRPPVPECLDRVIVPLNLRDSLMYVCRKKSSDQPCV